MNAEGGGELYISVGRRGCAPKTKKKNEKDGRALKSNFAALRDAARRHANLVAWQMDGQGGAFQSTRKVLTLQDTKNTASPIGDAVFLARPEGFEPSTYRFVAGHSIH